MKAAVAPEPRTEDAAAAVAIEDAIDDNVERLAPEDQRGLEYTPRALLRRFIRCLYLGVTLVFAYAAVTIYLLPYERVHEVNSYNVDVGLTLDVLGCDIRFVQGDAPTVELVAASMAYLPAVTKPTETGEDSDGTDVSSFTAKNVRPEGCINLPKDACHVVCYIDVTVPPAAASTEFSIIQAGSDTNKPLVHVKPGVTFGSLKTVDRPKNMPILIEEASIGSVDLTVKDGDFYAVRSTIGQIRYVSYTPGMGSAYLIGVTTDDDDVSLAWRQPSNRVCLASTEAAPGDAAWALAHPDDAFANCDVRDLLADEFETETWFAGSALRRNYDADLDSRISSTEFVDGLQELVCCGGNCPFSTSCQSRALRMGYGGGGSNEQTIDEFVWNMYATNETAWFPRCTTGMELHHAAGGRAMTNLGPALVADGGEIQVIVGSPAPPAAPVPLPPTAAMASYTPVAKRPGFRLRWYDAARIRETYGANYGDRDSTEHAVIVFDVHLGGSIEPHSRWLYSTRSAYLSLDPAVVGFLSMGLLMPPIFREKVQLLDNGCTYYGSRIAFDGETLSAQEQQSLYPIVQMFLARALKTNPRDRGSARPGSALVRLGTKSDFEGTPTSISDSYNLLEYPTASSSTGSSKENEKSWDDPAVSGNLQAALLLSIIVGAINSFVIVGVVSKILLGSMKDAYEKKLTAMIVVLRNQNVPNAAEVAKSMISKPSRYNPWTEPERVIDLLFVKTLKNRLQKPLKMFVRRNFELVDKKTDHRFVYLREFSRQFETFCLMEDLTATQSPTELTQQLIGELDVRVKAVPVQRIQGLRFRKPDETIPLSQVSSTARSALETAPQIIAAFIASRCIEDSNSFFIDVETRNGPDGTPKTGLKEALADWCKEHGLEAPLLSEDDLRGALPGNSSYSANHASRQIHGLAWKGKGSGGKTSTKLSAAQRLRMSFSFDWHAVELATVMAHFIASCFLPFILVVYACGFQSGWGTYLAPLNDIDGKQPARWTDVVDDHVGPLHVVTGFHSDQSYVHPIVGFMLYEAYVYLCASFLGLLVLYLLPLRTSPDDIKQEPLLTIWAWLLSFVHIFHVLLCSTYVGVGACWVLLSAALDPSRFLPLGAAVGAVIVAGTVITKQLTDAAKKLHDKLVAQYTKYQQKAVSMAIEKLQEAMKRSKGDKAKPRGIDDEVGQEEEEEKKPSLPAAPTPEALFAALNVDDADELSMAEFESLFEMIGINIPASKREQLFAYMDASGDGWISEKEFRAGWSKMTIDFVKAMAAEEGLSSRQILIVVMYTLTILCLVLTFIMLTLSSWNTTSTFQSTVQSGLVGSLGKATTALRTRARAETEDLSNLIDTKIDIQEEIAADDGNFGRSTEQSTG